MPGLASQSFPTGVSQLPNHLFHEGDERAKKIAAFDSCSKSDVLCYVFCGILDLAGRMVTFVANVAVAVSFFLDHIPTVGAVLFRKVTEELKDTHHL